MRLRERRRIEKRARVLANKKLHPPEFRDATIETLEQIARDPARGWLLRSQAIQLLDLKQTPSYLWEELFASEEEVPLLQGALTIESLDCADAPPRLIEILKDANQHRRLCAARGLGWIRVPAWRVRSAKALVEVLADRDQPWRFRAEACESLHHLHWPGSIPILMEASREPDERIRFWAVYGLSGIRHRETGRLHPRAVSAIEARLNDPGIEPDFWSVGKEALGMLATASLGYRETCEAAVKRIMDDPNASAADRRWAEFFS
jgi:HEAT repeat protein